MIEAICARCRWVQLVGEPPRHSPTCPHYKGETMNEWSHTRKRPEPTINAPTNRRGEESSNRLVVFGFAQWCPVCHMRYQHAKDCVYTKLAKAEARMETAERDRFDQSRHIEALEIQCRAREDDARIKQAHIEALEGGLREIVLLTQALGRKSRIYEIAAAALSGSPKQEDDR